MLMYMCIPRLQEHRALTLLQVFFNSKEQNILQYTAGSAMSLEYRCQYEK